MSDKRPLHRSSCMSAMIHPILLSFLAFCLIPNLPYYLWLDRFAPTRAIVNVDYLILGIIAIFVSPVVMTIMFIVTAIVDAFVFISTLYHFTPRELVMSMSYARYSPIKVHDLPLIDMAMMVLVIAVAIVIARRVCASKCKGVPIGLACLLVLITIIDIVSGSNTHEPFTHLPFYSRVQRIAANPANSGFFAANLKSFMPFGHQPVMIRTASASQVALGPWRDPPKRNAAASSDNVALIVVESWGQIDGSKELTNALLAPLLTPAVTARYDIRTGSVPFHGSTTSAELRELCGFQGSYHDLFNVPRYRCLPDTFAEQGYDITGMHGFYGDMFDRKSWCHGSESEIACFSMTSGTPDIRVPVGRRFPVCAMTT